MKQWRMNPPFEWYKTQDLPKYETPSVTTDMVAYCFVEGQIKLLVIKRQAHPYQNKYALVRRLCGQK